ncbi:MAG TPA: AraC family transcriptional regulator [Balneolaceae bacterium]|nr:AraC family transcriptional regulator [Balneolaceae bacterium]
MNLYEKKMENIKENHRNNLTQPKGDWPEMVQRARRFIIIHLFTEKLTVGWMKKKCRINSHNFSAKFARFAGRTPKQFIVYHRVAVAKKLLKSPAFVDLSISEIAYELGFATVSTFSKAFKRKVGMPPGRWRKEHL